MSPCSSSVSAPTQVSSAISFKCVSLEANVNLLARIQFILQPLLYISTLTPVVYSHDLLEAFFSPMQAARIDEPHSSPPYRMSVSIWSWYRGDWQNSQTPCSFLQTARRKHDRKDELSKFLPHVKTQDASILVLRFLSVVSSKFIWLFHCASVYPSGFYVQPVLTKMETEIAESERK